MRHAQPDTLDEMEEYALSGFLEDSSLRSFALNDTPIHVTLVDNFYSITPTDELVNLLGKVVAELPRVTITGKAKALFGPENNMSVTEVLKTPELEAMHFKLLATLTAYIRPKYPDFVGPGYHPHVTDQPSGGLQMSKDYPVKSLSLVKIHKDTATILVSFYFKPR
jgi:2'-5' RNA ligase